MPSEPTGVGGIHNREWGAALVDGSNPYLGSNLNVDIRHVSATIAAC